MSLTPEWLNRLQRWRAELPLHFYRPLKNLDLSVFITYDSLTPAQAAAMPFAPIEPGTPWGAKWQYGWFQAEILLPDEARGQFIVARLDTGGESAVYIDGIAAGAIDRQHKELILTRAAQPGERYSLLLESYAGHGPVRVSGGPVPTGRAPIPETPATQTAVGENHFGIWQEEIYQLWLDVETLFEVRENLDPDSLRVAEIDYGLRDFTMLVDFELPRDEFLQSVAAARERLAPLLKCNNGSTIPTLFAFGNAHIDVAWLWPLAETERKCVRTFTTALRLMEDYPEYIFLQSQPHLYRMVKEKDPELYARIQAAARSGQWIPDGGAWVEPDTNLTGGESLIRQFIHGKRFFREEFGCESELLWLPDVFGYSGALPQLMRGCGIRYFTTQKLSWVYNGGDPFPYNTFIWEGIDGSEVYAHMHDDYTAATNPATLIKRWNQRVQKDGIATRLFPFGFGDGGGGPTRDHLEFLRRTRDLEGVPKTRIAGPLEFFKDQEARGWPAARYVGELYLQVHRGTYTTQARTKYLNRRSELTLREAEFWGSAARALARLDFSPGDLDEAWKTVLLNHFHDILPGSSIRRVYEEAEAAYQQVLETAQATIQKGLEQLTRKEPGLTVFNSLSWPRRVQMRLPEDWSGACDPTGEALPTQETSARIWTEVNLPPCGWMTLKPGNSAESLHTLSAESDRLENEHLRVILNERGEITSLFDKDANRELAAGICNQMALYKDVPSNWDAWDIDSNYSALPVPLQEPARIEVLATGPLFAQLRVTRKIHNSSLIQHITLRHDSRRIDFETQIDWQETHKLLKVNFPVEVYADHAVHEIQFGHLRRPNHTSRQFDADRFEVSNHKWTALVAERHGCAVLNDGKYGVNVSGKSINLTLLRSPIAPDQTADRGMQTFTYAFYAWNGAFHESRLVQEGYELNIPVQTAAGIPTVLGPKASIFSIDAPNILLETLKPAEDGSPDLIVRLYESMRSATLCTLTTPLPVKAVMETDMLENPGPTLPITVGQVLLSFQPFEVKTLRLKLHE